MELEQGQREGGEQRKEGASRARSVGQAEAKERQRPIARDKGERRPQAGRAAAAQQVVQDQLQRMPGQEGSQGT